MTQAADAPAVDPQAIKDEIVKALKTCYDPEIPVDIYELGLIYEVDVTPEGVANVKMTLTAPNCPAAQFLPAEARQKVASVPGVSEANVEVVWDPMWTPARMSEAAKLQLGML